MKNKNEFGIALSYTIVLPPYVITNFPVVSYERTLKNYEKRNAQFHSNNFICKNKFT